MISAKMVCDSISEAGIRLSTIQVTMPKFLLAQLNTHRMFSRNAASSRAIPNSKVIERVSNDPVVPIYWGKNKPGMQATEEISDNDRFWAEYAWGRSLDNAVEVSWDLCGLGVHKQITNRLLEPFMYVDVLVTATEWDNFFDLRLHDSTQPEMREVARVMRNAMDSSTPNFLRPGEWHLPYADNTILKTDDWLWTLVKVSVARCARVSYLNHDQSNPDLKKDLELYDMLLKDKHLSPFEHQATPMEDLTRPFTYDGVGSWLKPGETHADKYDQVWSGNFRGWIQNRHII